MVAPPLVTDVYQVTTVGTLNGMPCDHVLHWHMPGLSASSTDVAHELANSDVLAWMPQWASNLPTYYTHLSSNGVYLGAGAGPATVAIAGSSGTAAGPFGSHATCITIRHAVPVKGRGRQGRTNVPGPAVDSIAEPSGQLTTAAQTAYTTAFATYRGAIQARMLGIYGISPEIVILSKKTGVYLVPTNSQCDVLPNTHRRWQKRLARH